MKCSAASQSLNGRNVFALMCEREREARIDSAPIRKHGAGAALATVTALLCAGETDVFAQRLEQRDARLDFQRVRTPVYVERDLLRAGHGSFRHGGDLGHQGLA